MQLGRHRFNGALLSSHRAILPTPHDDRAYTIFAQAMDRSGYARGTLAPREGMQADVPELDPRPLLAMADMMGDMSGMHGMDHGAMKKGGWCGE